MLETTMFNEVLRRAIDDVRGGHSDYDNDRLLD